MNCCTKKNMYAVECIKEALLKRELNWKNMNYNPCCMTIIKTNMIRWPHECVFSLTVHLVGLPSEMISNQ